MNTSKIFTKVFSCFRTDKCTKRYIARVLAGIMFSSLFLQLCYAQADSTECFPMVKIYRTGFGSHQICLNNFKQAPDSCVDLTIAFPGMGVDLLFHRNRENPWKYIGIESKQTDIVASVKVEISDNQNGVFSSAVITVDSAEDSLGEKIAVLQFSGDRISHQDSLLSIDYTISEYRYLCMKPVKVITDRKFTYPPGYMRRDQRLNHPELSMFHCGKGVRMPQSNSLWERGLMIVKYKVLHPPELLFDNPEKIEKQEAWKNRFKKRPEKKKKEKKRSGLIKINPL